MLWQNAHNLMTALKPLKVSIPVTPPENDKPVVLIADDLVAQYNEASKVAKDAAKIMEAIGPKLKVSAVEHLFRFNIEHPTAPATTVVVKDAEGAQANVSFKNAYGKEVDEKKALAALDAAGCDDPNLYLVESLKVAFDGSAFSEKNGDVRLPYYKAMQAAMQAVADKFGHPNPLSTQKVVAVRSTFHEVRFAIWPSVKTQAALSIAIPNQVSLTPLEK